MVAPADARTPHRRRTVLAVVAWAALLVVIRLWGLWELHHARGDMVLGAIPLFGVWDLRLGLAAAIAAAVALAFGVVAPVVARRWAWRPLLVGVALGAAVWALALGGVDGARVLGESIPVDYANHTRVVDRAGGPRDFLRTYVDRQGSYPVHLKAHPPGMTLFLWAAKRVGLRSRAWYIGLPLVASGIAAAAALVALADVSSQDVARRAAPFVALAPAAVWRVNADAVFAAPVLVAIALVVVATAKVGSRAVALAAAGGVCFGAALLLSYGLAALFLPAAAVAVMRRRWAVLAAAVAGVVAVLLLPLAAGFNWIEGLQETRRQYALSVAAIRPYRYFVVANLGVAALATGPAVAAGLARLRLTRQELLVWGALAALMIVDVSGLSKSEVERIWQPFYPLLLCAAAAATDRWRNLRWWLAGQLAVSVALQCSLRSPW